MNGIIYTVRLRIWKISNNQTNHYEMYSVLAKVFTILWTYNHFARLRKKKYIPGSMVLFIRLRRLIMSGRLSGDFSMSIDTDRWKLRITIPSTISLPEDKTWKGRKVYKIQIKKNTTLFIGGRDE